MKRPRLFLAALSALSVAWTVPAVSAAPPAPALIVTYETSPADRADLRREMASDEAARLEQLKRAHALTSYRLLFNRYADTTTWDGVALLRFNGEAGIEGWNALESTYPGGLSERGAKLTTAIRTAPADLVREGQACGPEVPRPAYLVIPYEALVPVPEYLNYLDAYTIPQLNGWMREGVLCGFEIYLPRYAAGRPWSALLVLKYRDDAALSRREAVVAKVREQLSHDPAWKKVSDNKKTIRNEKQLIVADDLAAGPPR